MRLEHWFAVLALRREARMGEVDVEGRLARGRAERERPAPQ